MQRILREKIIEFAGLWSGFCLRFGKRRMSTNRRVGSPPGKASLPRSFSLVSIPIGIYFGIPQAFSRSEGFQEKSPVAHKGHAAN